MNSANSKKGRPLAAFDELKEPYLPLLRRIRRRRAVVALLAVVAYLLLLALGLPLYLEWMGEVVISREGMPPVLLALSILLILVIHFFAYAAAMSPVYLALTAECDPEKYLVLQSAFVRTEPQRSASFSDGLFFLGRYREAAVAMDSLSPSLAKRNEALILYNRARCAFMLGDLAALSAARAALPPACESHLAKGGKRAAHCRIMLAEAALMQALSDTEAEDAHIRRLAAELPKTDPAQINLGFFCFLHGLAAYRLQDTEDRIYYLRRTCEIMPKTAIAAEAARYLRDTDGGGGASLADLSEKN